MDVRCLRGSDKALINVTEKPSAACGSVAFLGTHPYRHERRKTTRRASSVLLGHKVETELTASALIVGRDKESARNFALELSRENSAIIARALISRWNVPMHFFLAARLTQCKKLEEFFHARRLSSRLFLFLF